VRYLLIGVSGANFYTHPAASRFVTDDYDLFLPPEPENLVQAWAACDDAGSGSLTNRSIDPAIAGLPTT
jgi:hypothetical protein